MWVLRLQQSSELSSHPTEYVIFLQGLAVKTLFFMPISSHSIYGMARNWHRILGIWASVDLLFIHRLSFEGSTLLAVFYWF